MIVYVSVYNYVDCYMIMNVKSHNEITIQILH